MTAAATSALAPPVYGEEPALPSRIEQALRATGYAPLREVDIRVRGGRVVLRGRVPSYYLKQVAQEAARALAGEHGLQNELEVVSPSVVVARVPGRP